MSLTAGRLPYVVLIAVSVAYIYAQYSGDWPWWHEIAKMPAADAAYWSAARFMSYLLSVLAGFSAIMLYRSFKSRDSGSDRDSYDGGDPPERGGGSGKTLPEEAYGK